MSTTCDKRRDVPMQIYELTKYSTEYKNAEQHWYKSGMAAGNNILNLWGVYYFP